MRSAEANFSTLLDMCLTLDAKQLHQQIKPIYCKTYGLDFVFNDQKQNLLHVLAAMPRFANWEVLLKAFLYLDLIDACQHTALFIAVRERNMGAVESLVMNEASPLVEDEHGINAIQFACQTNNCEALKCMMKSLSAVRYVAMNVIRIGKLCIENNAVEAFEVVLRFLPEKKCNAVDDDGLGLIHHMVLAEKLAFLKVFLKLNNDPANPNIDINLKAKIDGKEKTPLEMATSIGIAEFLFANGGTYNKKMVTPIITDVVSRASQWQNTGFCFSPTDLHKAAMEGNLNAIKSYNGKKIDIVDSFQMTPLLYAISGFQTQIISILIEKGANPNFFTGLTTAYHFAALKGNVNSFHQLVSVKPDFSILDSEGRSIITCAVTNGNPEIILAVLKLNPPIDLSLVAILDLVRKMNDMKASSVFTALLTTDFPLNYPYETNKTLLLTALEAGKINLAKTILTKQIGKNITDYELDPENCLIESVVNEYHDIVKLLLDANVSPEIINNGRPLIHDTVGNKDNATRNLLLEKNPSLSSLVDQMGNTFLHRAALINQSNSIKVGVEEFKIDVNAKNKLGLTPLLLLIENKSDDFKQNFNYLVQKGADISMVDRKQKNILHLCTEYGNLKALKDLIGSRKNESEVLLSNEQISTLLQGKDCDGLTPLEFASKNKDYKYAYIISKYIQLSIFDSKITLESLNEHESKKFSPNVYNTEGISLLICSLLQYESDKEQTIAIIQKLMAMKANPSLPNKVTKLMPIHYAIKLGSKELVQILMENGANFLVEPIITSYAHDNEQEEIADLVKLPERRASAIYELLAIQDNVVPTLACICKNPNIFGCTLDIFQYIHQVRYMHRVLMLFRKRFRKIFAELKLSTEIGPFLLYFADAFLPLLEIAATYERVIYSIRNSPKYSIVLKTPSGHNKLSFDDALIVPTQQFTYYPELIKAIIHVMPKDHPDIQAIKKAQIKFAYIGRTINERKLIAESQKELQAINLITTIYDKTTKFTIDDILLSHGQFERKSYKPPQKDKAAVDNPTILADNLDWGLRTSQQTIGNLSITNFTPFGSSMESFLNKNKIAIYLFRTKILFGIQKNTERFKLKFSCYSSEVLWDFGKEYGPDSVMLYAPFGSLLLKFTPPKGTKVNFERNRWRSDVEKLSVIDEADNQSIGGYEYCYVSWVSASSFCVNSREFFIKCKTKTEAREKILNELKNNGIDILCRPNPLINFDFQTQKRNEGQESDVVSDLYDE